MANLPNKSINPKPYGPRVAPRSGNEAYIARMKSDFARNTPIPKGNISDSNSDATPPASPVNSQTSSDSLNESNPHSDATSPASLVNSQTSSDLSNISQANPDVTPPASPIDTQTNLAFMEQNSSSSISRYGPPVESQAALDVSGAIIGAVQGQVPPLHNPSQTSQLADFATDVATGVLRDAKKDLANQARGLVVQGAKHGLRYIVGSSVRVIQNAFTQRRSERNQQRPRRERIVPPERLQRSGSGSIHIPDNVGEPNTPVVSQELDSSITLEAPSQNRMNPEIPGHMLLTASHDSIGHTALSGSCSRLPSDVGSHLSRSGSGNIVMNTSDITGFKPPYPELQEDSNDSQRKNFALDDKIIGYNCFSRQARETAAAKEAKRLLRKSIKENDALEASQPAQNQTIEQVPSNLIMPKMSTSSVARALHPPSSYGNLPVGHPSITFDTSNLNRRELSELQSINRQMGFVQRMAPESDAERQAPSSSEPSSLIFDEASLTQNQLQQINEFKDKIESQVHWRYELIPQAKSGSQNPDHEQVHLAIKKSLQDKRSRAPRDANVDSLSGSNKPSLSSIPENISSTSGQNQPDLSPVPDQTDGPLESTQAKESTQLDGNGNPGDSTPGTTSTGADNPLQAAQPFEDPNPAEVIEPPDPIIIPETKEIEARFAPNLNAHFNFRGHHLRLGPEARIKYNFNDSSWSPSLRLYFNLDIAANKICFEHKDGYGRHTLVGLRIQNGNRAFTIDSKRGSTDHVPFNHLHIGIAPDLSNKQMEIVGVFDLNKSISFPHILLRPTNAFNIYTKPLLQLPLMNSPIEFKVDSVPSLQFGVTKFTTHTSLYNKEIKNLGLSESNTSIIDQHTKQLESILKITRTLSEQSTKTQENQQELADFSQKNYDALAAAAAFTIKNIDNVGDITQNLVQSSSNETKQTLEQLQKQNQECCDITHKSLDALKDGLSGVTNQIGDAANPGEVIKNLLAAGVFYQFLEAVTKSLFSMTVYAAVTYTGVWCYAKVQRSIIICSQRKDAQPNFRTFLIGASLCLKAFAFVTCGLVCVNTAFNILLNKNFFELWPFLRGTPLSENGTLVSEEFLQKIRAQQILSPIICVTSFVFTGMFVFGAAPLIIGLFSGTMSIGMRNRGIALLGSFVGFYLSRKLYASILKNYGKYEPSRTVFIKFVVKIINDVIVTFVTFIGYTKTGKKKKRVFAFVKGLFFVSENSIHVESTEVSDKQTVIDIKPTNITEKPIDKTPEKPTDTDA